MARVDGDQIKIGIDAPREITVHQQEIQEDIDNAKPADEGSTLKAALGLPM